MELHLIFFFLRNSKYSRLFFSSTRVTLKFVVTMQLIGVHEETQVWEHRNVWPLERLVEGVGQRRWAGAFCLHVRWFIYIYTKYVVNIASGGFQWGWRRPSLITLVFIRVNINIASGGFEWGWRVWPVSSFFIIDFYVLMPFIRFFVF